MEILLTINMSDLNKNEWSLLLTELNIVCFHLIRVWVKFILSFLYTNEIVHLHSWIYLTLCTNVRFIHVIHCVKKAKANSDRCSALFCCEFFLNLCVFHWFKVICIIIEHRRYPALKYIAMFQFQWNPNKIRILFTTVTNFKVNIVPGASIDSTPLNELFIKLKIVELKCDRLQNVLSFSHFPFMLALPNSFIFYLSWHSATPMLICSQNVRCVQCTHYTT